jgi:hypothetical protein
MSDAFHHIAAASLPVAIGLVVLTAIARALVNDERLGRIAREHIGALSTWCLMLVAVHAVALGGAGALGAGSVGVTLVIGAAAVLLRAEYGAEEEPDDDAPQWAGAARERPATGGEAAAAERAPAPAGASPAAHSLWAERDDDASSRSGLWA